MQRDAAVGHVFGVPMRFPISRTQMHLDVTTYTAITNIKFRVEKIRATQPIPATRLEHAHAFACDCARTRLIKI